MPINPIVANGVTMTVTHPTKQDKQAYFDQQPHGFHADGVSLMLEMPTMSCDEWSNVPVTSCSILSDKCKFDQRRCLFVGSTVQLENGYSGVVPPELGAGPWLSFD